MDRPKLEVADIFRRYGKAYRQQHDGSLSSAQRRVMTAIEVCRTAALGGHLERCDCCNYERPCYSSCRDRHCPKCQSLARAAWVEKRTSEVLQTHYFHVVFSVPEQIASITYQNKRSFTTFCFEPRPRPCPLSPPIPNIWAPKSVSLQYSIVGGRTCFFIRISIVSSRAAESLPMVLSGSPAAPASSYPCGCCPVCSDDCS